MCCPRLHIMRWVAAKLGRSKMHTNCTAVHMNPAEENVFWNCNCSAARSEENACDMYSCRHGPCRQQLQSSLDCNCAVEFTHGLEWRERSTCSLKWLHSLRPGSQQPPFPASFSESGAPPAFMAKQICQGSLPAVLRTSSFC